MIGRKKLTAASLAAAALVATAVFGGWAANRTSNEAGESVGGDAGGGEELAPVAGGTGGGVVVGSGTGSSSVSDGASATGSPLPTAVPASARETQVIRSAELRVELEKGGFREAFERAAFIAGSHQGFVVDSSSERGSDGLSSGAVVMRVPAENFDAARKDLAALGKVKSEQLKGEEVSGQLVDLEARLRNLRAHEDALRRLMERSAAVPDTMQVQQNLFGVREQIEQLAAQEARLKDGVAMSTIRIALAESGAALLDDPEPSTGLTAAFRRAVDGAVAVVSAVIVAVGYLTPLAVFAALGMLVLRLLRRPSRRLAAES